MVSSLCTRLHKPSFPRRTHKRTHTHTDRDGDSHFQSGERRRVFFYIFFLQIHGCSIVSFSWRPAAPTALAFGWCLPTVWYSVNRCSLDSRWPLAVTRAVQSAVALTPNWTTATLLLEESISTVWYFLIICTPAFSIPSLAPPPPSYTHSTSADNHAHTSMHPFLSGRVVAWGEFILPSFSPPLLHLLLSVSATKPREEKWEGEKIREEEEGKRDSSRGSRRSRAASPLIIFLGQRDKRQFQGSVTALVHRRDLPTLGFYSLFLSFTSSWDRACLLLHLPQAVPIVWVCACVKNLQKACLLLPLRSGLWVCDLLPRGSGATARGSRVGACSGVDPCTAQSVHVCVTVWGFVCMCVSWPAGRPQPHAWLARTREQKWQAESQERHHTDSRFWAVARARPLCPGQPGLLLLLFNDTESVTMFGLKAPLYYLPGKMLLMWCQIVHACVFIPKEL